MVPSVLLMRWPFIVMNPWPKICRGSGSFGAHQHRRPDHRVEPRDVLADDVQIRRPPLLEHLRIVAEADRRRVVDQRVEPDVDDARRIERQRDAPRLPGAADGDVLQPAFDQPQDLVAPDLGLQELRVRGEVIEQRLLILRQPEEVVLLADPLGLQRRVQRAVAVDEVLLLLELLAADAVPALVDAFVDVAGVVDAAWRGR